MSCLYCTNSSNKDVCGRLTCNVLHSLTTSVELPYDPNTDSPCPFQTQTWTDQDEALLEEQFKSTGSKSHCSLM